MTGEARGEALVLDEPLSFWGGVDPATGRLIDQHHPQVGESVRGRVLVTPALRGSTSSASVLAECARLGTGPAALLSLAPDAMAVVAALVAGELYGRAFPVVVLEPDAYRSIQTGHLVAIGASGEVVAERPDRGRRAWP